MNQNINASQRERRKLAFVLSLASNEDVPVTRFRKNVLFDVNVCQIILDFFCMCGGGSGNFRNDDECQCHVLASKTKELCQSYPQVWNLFRDRSLHYSYFLDAEQIAELDRDLLKSLKGPNQDRVPVLRWTDSGSWGYQAVFALWNESKERWRVYIDEERTGSIMGAADVSVFEFSDEFVDDCKRDTHGRSITFIDVNNVKPMQYYFPDLPNMVCPSLKRYYRYLDTNVRKSTKAYESEDVNVRKRKFDKCVIHVNSDPDPKRCCVRQ